jgi:hypothetical protein
MLNRVEHEKLNTMISVMPVMSVIPVIYVIPSYSFRNYRNPAQFSAWSTFVGTRWIHRVMLLPMAGRPKRSRRNSQYRSVYPPPPPALQITVGMHRDLRWYGHYLLLEVRNPHTPQQNRGLLYGGHGHVHEGLPGRYPYMFGVQATAVDFASYTDDI